MAAVVEGEVEAEVEDQAGAEVEVGQPHTTLEDGVALTTITELQTIIAMAKVVCLKI